MCQLQKLAATQQDLDAKIAAIAEELSSADIQLNKAIKEQNQAKFLVESAQSPISIQEDMLRDAEGEVDAAAPAADQADLQAKIKGMEADLVDMKNKIVSRQDHYRKAVQRVQSLQQVLARLKVKTTAKGAHIFFSLCFVSPLNCCSFSSLVVL